jgi:predicted nucleic acid-binding protein
MPVLELDFEAVLPRAWGLRGSFTFTDATYIAVAEMTGTTLLTADRRIRRGPVVRCPIVLPPRNE